MKLTTETCAVNQLVWKVNLCHTTGATALHKGIVLQCFDGLKKVLPLQHPLHFGIDFQGRVLEAPSNWYGTSSSAIANSRKRLNEIAEKGNNNLNDLVEG